MSHYKTTVTTETEDGIELEVVLQGYCGHDGGQSDVEAPTEYYVDGEQVEDLDELSSEIRDILYNMEYDHNNVKDYKVKHEYPQPYNEWD